MDIKEYAKQQLEYNQRMVKEDEEFGKLIQYVAKLVGAIGKVKDVYPEPIYIRDGRGIVCPKCGADLSKKTLVGENCMHYKLLNCPNCDYEYAEIYYEDYV